MSPSPAIGGADARTPSIATARVVDALKRVFTHYADPHEAAALAESGRLVPQLTEALTHDVVRTLAADPWSAADAPVGYQGDLRAALRRVIADLLPALIAAWGAPEHGCARLSVLVDVYLDAGGRADLEEALGQRRGPAHG